MNNVQKQKGITLIALVITIVVLIILAGVAINLSLGENGIFNKAKLAKEDYINAENYEQENIKNLTNEIDNYEKDSIYNSRELKEEDIDKLLYPNKSLNLSFQSNQVTIPKSGWLYISFFKAPGGNIYGADKNGKQVLIAACHEVNTANSAYIPVKEGDVITVSDQSYFSLRLDYYEKTN